uniref:Agouti-signaling protein-like n=1 Tax=Cyprinus carpio TaxID=7962 RepID=A0A8C1TVY2_CYPCA
MMKRFVLFVCLFFTVVQSITCEANRIDARKKHENDVAHHSSATTAGAWSQEKPKRLFARTRYLSQQRHHVVVRSTHHTVSFNVDPNTTNPALFKWTNAHLSFCKSKNIIFLLGNRVNPFYIKKQNCISCSLLCLFVSHENMCPPET